MKRASISRALSPDSQQLALPISKDSLRCFQPGNDEPNLGWVHGAELYLRFDLWDCAHGVVFLGRTGWWT